MGEAAENSTLNSIFGPERLFEIEKSLIRRQMALLGNPPITIVLWNGSKVSPARGNSVGTVTIRNRKHLLKLLFQPELYFGDAYSDGNIEVEGDLISLLETIFRSKSRASKSGLINEYLFKIINSPKSNSLDGSKDNIHHHYDIGNDFYRLWLDEKMQYTCAYFSSPSATLEEAQIEKMDHVCKKLRLRPGDTVVEAGCGWGMLALHMARHYGVRVTSYNISHEQILFARERAKADGLEDRVEYVEDDYRNISGRFDAFISVGMLEHVGPSNYRELGRVIQRALKEDGGGLIHSIGRNRAGLMNPWTERRIFPGAYMPTLKEMMEIFESSGFSILDVENLRLHYAKTLGCWLERFERANEQIGDMFDQNFIRSWRLYLAGSIASFTTGDLQLFQVVFTHSTNNDLPWSRAHLYADISH
jgi:cyclopropane-fatty-acyl-phospholipid synthase